jgi:hypothetical protein
MDLKPQNTTRGFILKASDIRIKLESPLMKMKGLND